PQDPDEAQHEVPPDVARRACASYTLACRLGQRSWSGRHGDVVTSHSRRSWLRLGIAGPVGAALWRGSAEAARRQGAPGATANVSAVKALVFDVFGTVVDWRSSVTAEVQELAKRKNVTVDAAKFADAWRAGYGPSMNRVRTGELPWTRLDALHRMTLD